MQESRQVHCWMSEEENQSGMLNQRAVTPIVRPIGAEWWPRDIDRSIAEVRMSRCWISERIGGSGATTRYSFFFNISLFLIFIII